MALNVRYLKGTSDRYAEYLALDMIEDLNFYYLTDINALYLGKIKLSNQEDFQKALQAVIGEYDEMESIPTIKDLELMALQTQAEMIELEKNVEIRTSWGKIK